MFSIDNHIANEMKVKPTQVAKAIALLEEGATVPFIARYRKEATGGLTDVQLRYLEERLLYLKDFLARRETILEKLKALDKLSPELEQALMAAQTKMEIEDLYRPHKPKRHTKGQIAIEAGLQPLADALLTTSGDPLLLAKDYINLEKNIADEQAALEGAKAILIETISEIPEGLASIRQLCLQKGRLLSQLKDKKEAIKNANKYQDYFDHNEAFARVPSHRALAMLRGRKAGVLRLQLVLPEELLDEPVMILKNVLKIDNFSKETHHWLYALLQLCWKAKIQPHLEADLFQIMRETAEEKAIQVFASNIRDVLMASPAGQKTILGLDPGVRTGVKVAVINKTGTSIDTTVLYPHPPQKAWEESKAALKKLITQHEVSLIAIGNGTASRETEQLVKELIKEEPTLGISYLVVSEAGASVYSASELASQELKELDVSLRGAVSIARRLQDPLSELVKIDPKSIGVGQYQHDVNQTKLSRSLTGVVENCVNRIGVDINTASPALLSYIAGLNKTLAENIVAYRDKHGRFQNREEYKQVQQMGEKTFEQAAGFLRIHDGNNPLDASGIHPEQYPVVEKIATALNASVAELVGNPTLIEKIEKDQFISEEFGFLSLSDVLKELGKPGRDPRPRFKTVQFKEGINAIEDLKPDMVLEGVVSNVTNFGAFVDIGVHQDGLIHISAMTNKFIKDPHQLVKAGQIIKVKVLDVNLDRNRISLSLVTSESTQSPAKKDHKPKEAGAKYTPAKKPQKEKVMTPRSALGEALLSALQQSNRS
jgi:uncharacterized protein